MFVQRKPKSTKTFHSFTFRILEYWKFSLSQVFFLLHRVTSMSPSCVFLWCWVSCCVQVHHLAALSQPWDQSSSLVLQGHRVSTFFLVFLRQSFFLFAHIPLSLIFIVHSFTLSFLCHLYAMKNLSTQVYVVFCFVESMHLDFILLFFVDIFFCTD